MEFRSINDVIRLPKLSQKTRSGIYVFRSTIDGKPLYFGKDKSLVIDERLKGHTHNKKPTRFDKALQTNPKDFIYQQLLICKDEDADFIEEALISYYLPEHNYEYKEKIYDKQEETIGFIKHLKRAYNINEKDMTKLLTIIQLRCL